MADDKTKDKTVATEFQDVSVPAITSGAKNATISGKLVRKDTGEGIGGVEVRVTLKTTPPTTATYTTDAGGNFTRTLDVSHVAAATGVDFGFAGNSDAKLGPCTKESAIILAKGSSTDLVSPGSQLATATTPAPDFRDKGAIEKSADATSESSQKPEYPNEPPATSHCNPCTDLISTAKRVLRDPDANKAVSDYILGMAKGNTEIQNNALEEIAKAIKGKDALEAVGEGCRAQLRLEMWTFDAIRKKVRKLEREELKEIDVQLLENGDLAAATRIYEEDEIFFPSVAANAERTHSFLQNAAKNEVNGETTVSVLFPWELAYGAVWPVYLTSDPDSREFTNVFIREPHQPKTGSNADGLNQNAKREDELRKEIAEDTPPEWAPRHKVDKAHSKRQFEFRVMSGKTTLVKFVIMPHVAHVRVFSCVEGDPCCLQGSCVDEDCRCSQGDCPKEDCSCTKSKQYISKVAITASNEGSFVNCGKTSDSGCVTFKLSPGWYQFSAPEDVKIAGCNYTLCSSSPISAYLGASQFCSDIFFCYKKKGTEIEVISEIEYPEPGNPYKEARNNLPGMQYLLVREGDPSSARVQTTTDGSALRFENVPVGTYLLFCQGPPTYNSQPVEPVRPEHGRMALRVFAGQAHSKIPVLVKFRQSRTTPAVLAGFVRDNTGTPVPQQLVQVANGAGAILAAGLTDANGFYSIQIYNPENLTIVVGTQQIAVSKSEIQADMSTGPKMLPSPRMAMLDATEATLMPELNS